MKDERREDEIDKRWEPRKNKSAVPREKEHAYRNINYLKWIIKYIMWKIKEGQIEKNEEKYE
jgi:hypothetical protein